MVFLHERHPHFIKHTLKNNKIENTFLSSFHLSTVSFFNLFFYLNVSCISMCFFFCFEMNILKFWYEYHPNFIPNINTNTITMIDMIEN